MSILFPRFLKSIYRKEPISSFIFIIGLVDALLGGFSERWSLLSWGLLIVASSVAVRWLKIQKRETAISPESPRRYLPPSSTSTPLPMLKKEQYRR